MNISRFSGATHLQNNDRKSWLDDLKEVYSELGGQAHYDQIYPLVRERRIARNASWTKNSDATIRNAVQNNEVNSSKKKSQNVFYSVEGIGNGTWGLMPQYFPPLDKKVAKLPEYLEGIEGILREVTYLRRSRDPTLVEHRKKKDNYTCQVCNKKLQISPGKYVIDVHHLNPLGSIGIVSITNIEDLICLCPICHRIAHSNPKYPLTLKEISVICKNNNF